MFAKPKTIFWNIDQQTLRIGKLLQNVGHHTYELSKRTWILDQNLHYKNGAGKFSWRKNKTLALRAVYLQFLRLQVILPVTASIFIWGARCKTSGVLHMDYLRVKLGSSAVQVIASLRSCHR